MVSHAPETNGMPVLIGGFCRCFIKKTDVGRVISEAISFSVRIVWTYSVKGERCGDIYIVGPGQGVCITVIGLMLSVDSG